MNFQNLFLPVNVSMTITPEFKHFKGIENLVHSCKQATTNVNFPINVKAKISLQMNKLNSKSNGMIFTLPQRLDCVILNQRYLNIRFTLVMTETETGTTQEIKQSVIFLCVENSELRYVPHSVLQFSIKCELEILPEQAEGEHVYPCTYRKFTVPEKELEWLDHQSGWKPKEQPTRQPARQPVQQPTRQQTVPQRVQVIPPNVLRGEQQNVARRKVQQQLTLPTSELIIGEDGSFFVRSRITNTILYEGTFSVFKPGTIEKYPNTSRCVLSSQPIIYQPVYQPIYQPTNQPIQRAITIFGNSQPPQMIQFGLPPNIQPLQPRVQQRQTRGRVENVIHIQQRQQPQQPQQVVPPAVHNVAVPQQQPQRVLPTTKAMEEETSGKSLHEDVEKGMSTGNHYQPISIDLSVEDDERTLTAENSETEELS